MAQTYDALKKDIQHKMDVSLHHAKKEFSGLRTGPAGHSLLEPVGVEAYGNEVLKKMEKDHLISQDEHRKYSDEIQKLTDQLVAKVDEALKHKETEITQV